MPIINLIQEQRVADQKRDQRTRIAGYTFLITVGFGVLGYVIILFQESACIAEIRRLNQDIAANKPIVEQIEACKKTTDTMKPKLDSLDEARKVSGKWSNILTRLETQTPADTWLTGLQCPQVQDDKPITMTFTGTAKAQKPIGEFVLRTQNQAYLDNVTLHFTQEKRSAGGSKQIDFEVAADILDSAEKKAAIKEDQKS